jgi:hypothetical protein
MACPKKPKTPLQAIRAKCLDCSGGYVAEVEYCPIPDCPLYAFRSAKVMRLDLAPALNTRTGQAACAGTAPVPDTDKRNDVAAAAFSKSRRGVTSDRAEAVKNVPKIVQRAAASIRTRNSSPPGLLSLL